MAAKDRKAMITLVLKRLGVAGTGRGARAEDSTLVGDLLDSLHDQLLVDGMVDFALTDGTATVPKWAQAPIVKCMVEEAGPYFGLLPQETAGQRNLGEAELRHQMTVVVRERPVEFRDY